MRDALLPDLTRFIYPKRTVRLERCTYAITFIKRGFWSPRVDTSYTLTRDLDAIMVYVPPRAPSCIPPWGHGILNRRDLEPWVRSGEDGLRTLIAL